MMIIRDAAKNLETERHKIRCKGITSLRTGSRRGRKNISASAKQKNSESKALGACSQAKGSLSHATFSNGTIDAIYPG